MFGGLRPHTFLIASHNGGEEGDEKMIVKKWLEEINRLAEWRRPYYKYRDEDLIPFLRKVAEEFGPLAKHAEVKLSSGAADPWVDIFIPRDKLGPVGIKISFRANPGFPLNYSVRNWSAAIAHEWRKVEREVWENNKKFLQEAGK